MSIRTRRVVNAFVLGFLTIIGTFLIEHEADLTSAIKVGDWHALKVLGLALIGACITGAARALQGYVKAIPSPEPSEN